MKLFKRGMSYYYYKTEWIILWWSLDSAVPEDICSPVIRTTQVQFAETYIMETVVQTSNMGIVKTGLVICPLL